MIVSMGVGVFTVRIILRALGVEDYGIFNVVGGLVSLMSFVSNSMAGSAQRFYSFDLGRNDEIKANNFFNLTLLAYLGISLIVLFVGETVGLYFLNNYLVIPETKILAANIVYQSTIFCFVLSMLTTPYLSAIIACEKMEIYAYVSIGEALAKLLIAYILISYMGNRLILYGLLLMASQTLISFIYVYTARKRVSFCSIHRYWNNNEMKQLLSFSTWSLLGAFSGAMQSQGVNIVINMFFGPMINAARGIAFQMQAIVNAFRVNFYNALAPQIIKSYASGNMLRMYMLLFSSCKFVFYLVLLFALPILLETNYILTLWLGTYPEYAVLFTRLVVIELIVDLFYNPFYSCISATGNIKNFQIWMNLVRLSIVPLSYITLRYVVEPVIPFVISIFICAFSYIVSFHFLIKQIELPLVAFIKDVVFPCVVVFTLSLSSSMAALHFCGSENFYRFAIVSFFSVVFVVIYAYMVGINRQEKEVIKTYVHKYIRR